MAQFSVFIAVSADGMIAGPDGGLGWLDRVQREGEDYGYAAFMETVDALVMGRSTFDVARGFGWPHDGRRVIVLTHRELADPPAGVVARAADPRAVAAELDGLRRVYVDGGAVIRSFLAAGLVDDLTLSIVPVVLGAGTPLFTGGPPVDLALESATPYPSGLVQLRYRVAR